MKNFLQHISLFARKVSSTLLEELCTAGTALHCRNGFALASGLSSARKASFALLTTVSLALAVLCTACADNDGIFNIEPVDLGSGFCIMPVSMIGEEIPYDSVPGEASGDSRAINAMTVDRENMIKKIAIFQFDKENNLRTLKNGQYYLYKDFAVFGSSTPNGVSLVNIDNMPELAQLLTSTKSDLYTCVIANASQELIEDAILPGGSPTDWPNFKEYSFPLPMATKADVENERDNLEYGHVTDIYMFGYYDGVVPPTGFTLGLGRVVSRIKIKFEAYENEEEHVSLDNLPSTARFFAAIRNLPRTGYFYPTTETPIQKSISDVYMLPELQFNPKSGSAILQFYCGPQLGSWIAEEDNTGTPLRTQLLLWCATNPEEYENADWNQYFLEQNLGKAVAIEFGNNPGAGDYGIVHNTVYSYTMGLGYGTSGIVIKPINIFAMVWLDQYNDWKWESNIGQESNPLILNIDSRASKHNFEIKKIFNRVWEQRNDYGFVEYMIRNKRDWTQVALKDNSATLQDDQIHFDFSTLNYSNLDTDRLMLVGATENNGVYTGLETEGVKLLPLANGTATFDINLAADYETTINGTATNFTSRTVHVTVPINGTFSHSLLPSKAPVSVLAPGTTTDIDDILADVSFKPIKTYNGYTVHNGDAYDIAASSLTAGTPVITGDGITYADADGQIVTTDDAEGTITIPYTYTFPANSSYSAYKYPTTLTYTVEIEVSNIREIEIWQGNQVFTTDWGLSIERKNDDGVFNDLVAGDKIRVYISEISPNPSQYQDSELEYKKWQDWQTLTGSSKRTITETGYDELELTDAMIAELKNNNGLRIQGQLLTVSRITLITASGGSGSNDPTPEPANELPYVMDESWGPHYYKISAQDWSSQSPWKDAKAGDVLKATATNINDGAQGVFKIMGTSDSNADWVDLGSVSNLGNGTTEFSVTLTEENITNLKKFGLAVGGIKYTLSDLTLEVSTPPVTIDKTLSYTFTLFKTDPDDGYKWTGDKAQNGGTPLDLGELGTDFNISHLLNYDTDMNHTYGYVAHTLENVDGTEYTYVELKKSDQVRAGQQEYDFSGLSYTTSDSKILISADNKIVPISAGTATFNVVMSTVPTGYTNIATPASVPVSVTIANSFAHELAPTGSIPGSLGEGPTALYDVFLASANFNAIKKYKNTEVLAEAITLSSENCQVTTSDANLVYFYDGNLVVPTGATGSATITITYTTSAALRDLGFSDTYDVEIPVTIGAQIIYTGPTTLTDSNGTIELSNTLFQATDIKAKDKIIVTGEISADGQYYSYFEFFYYIGYWASVSGTYQNPFKGSATLILTEDLVDNLKTNGLQIHGTHIIINSVIILPSN